MARADRLCWIHALTPLHLGVGRGEGYIDLPLMREKVTNFPFVPGSAIKGVVADSHDARDEARDPSNNATYRRVLHAAFGRAGDDLSNSGALVFTDARLICLAVRSLYGTFAWCTSPLVLRRLARDLSAAGCAGWPEPPADVPAAHVPAHATRTTEPGSLLTSRGKLYLEDLDLAAQACPVAGQWADWLGTQLFPDETWRGEFRQRFAVVPDHVFDFLAETATEVQPHVRIDPDFKRVVTGALWYEESLPAESILCGLVWCDEPRGVSSVQKSDMLDLLRDASLQLGGKATTGKGRVQVRFTATGGAATGQPAGNEAGGGA